MHIAQGRGENTALCAEFAYCPARSGVLESIDVVDKQRAARREALPKEWQAAAVGA